MHKRLDYLPWTIWIVGKKNPSCSGHMHVCSLMQKKLVYVDRVVFRKFNHTNGQHWAFSNPIASNFVIFECSMRSALFTTRLQPVSERALAVIVYGVGRLQWVMQCIWESIIMRATCLACGMVLPKVRLSSHIYSAHKQHACAWDIFLQLLCEYYPRKSQRGKGRELRRESYLLGEIRSASVVLNFTFRDQEAHEVM